MVATPESPQPTPASSGSLLNAGISRRGVVRTLAWSVPAVTVATAVPAYATSTHQLTLDDPGVGWISNASHAGGTIVAASGGVFLLSGSPEVPTPALRLELQFPAVWHGGTNVVSVAPNDNIDGTNGSWTASGWAPDSTPDSNGQITSANGSFAFAHPGGLTGTGAVYIDLPFIAWVSTGTNPTTDDTAITATLQILSGGSGSPTWEFREGPTFFVPVDSIGTGD